MSRKPRDYRPFVLGSAVLSLTIAMGICVHELVRVSDTEDLIENDAGLLTNDCLDNNYDWSELGVDMICHLLPDMDEDSSCPPATVQAIAKECSELTPSTETIVALSIFGGLPITGCIVLAGIMACSSSETDNSEDPLLDAAGQPAVRALSPSSQP